MKSGFDSFLGDSGDPTGDEVLDADPEDSEGDVEFTAVCFPDPRLKTRLRIAPAVPDRLRVSFLGDCCGAIASDLGDIMGDTTSGEFCRDSVGLLEDWLESEAVCASLPDKFGRLVGF